MHEVPAVKQDGGGSAREGAPAPADRLAKFKVYYIIIDSDILT